MAIQVASFIVPKNGNTWFVVEDKYIKGGLHVVQDAAERDAINPFNLKPGMLAVTQDDRKMWQLAADATTWEAFEVGGGSSAPVRQKKIYTALQILPDNSQDFVLPLGKTVVLNSLSVDTVCKVEAFETAARTDTNPYTFISTIDHLVDDGSTLMTDGTILRGRRYSILSNQELVPSVDIYFRITNLDKTNTRDVTLTLEFLPIE